VKDEDARRQVHERDGRKVEKGRGMAKM